MKSLLKYFSKNSTKQDSKVTQENESNSNNDFEFKIISSEERMNNRCNKYEFITK